MVNIGLVVMYIDFLMYFMFCNFFGNNICGVIVGMWMYDVV